MDVRAAEVAAEDVRLALASAEEAAVLGGEFGLVSGPVLLGQTVLRSALTSSSGFSSGEYGGRTTGVLPFSPQVRPVTWSDRIPTWSTKRISPPSAFAFARIVGQVS